MNCYNYFNWSFILLIDIWHWDFDLWTLKLLLCRLAKFLRKKTTFCNKKILTI